MLNTIALLVIFVSAPRVFILLYFVTAPYGRHFRGGWGPSIDARASWLLMELPAVVVIAAIVLFDGRKASLLAILMLGLWEVHYLYRTCLFPLLIRDNGKRFPIVLIVFAAIFNSLNGYANGIFLSGFSLRRWRRRLPTCASGIGIALFAGGVHHPRLGRPRPAQLRKPGEIGLQHPPRRALRVRLQPELLRRDHGMERLGAGHLVPRGPRLRRVHHREPGAPGPGQPRVVPGHLPRLPAGAQERHPVRVLSAGG